MLDPQGQLVMKRARSQRDISSFDLWLSACFLYEKYRVKAHPSRYSELCAYHDIIHSATRRFHWSAVYTYDVRFRSKMANGDLSRFDQLNQTLYITGFDATALHSDARQCA